jgi:outer membrane protein TolC
VPQPPALPTAEATARLRAAVNSAWDRSPELAGSPGRQAAATARGRSADSFTPGPPSLGGGFVADGVRNARGGREAELSLATPLWLPGEGTASRRVADADLTRLTAQQQAQRLAVAGEVREALAAVALAQIEAAGSSARLRDARSLEADVGRRVRGRDAAEAELLTARLDRMDAEIALGERQATLDGAKLAFRSLTGVEPEPAALNEPDPPQAVAGSHPRIAEAEGTAAAADASRRLAEIQTRDSPEIGILARSSREIGSTQYDNRIGIQFRLPFSTDTRNAPRQMAAQAELTEATATAANVRRQVELQAARARVELDTARQAAVTTRQRAAVYRQQRGLSEAAFRGGQASLADVIRVRALATEADVAQGRAEIALRLSRSRVNQSLGILP